jgi:uncharacterized protein with LGFP repeats
MTGLRTRFGTTVGRLGVGVGTVAATLALTVSFSLAGALLLAPMAAATPESDADAAITQAWDAAGGPTGSLGIKDGGVYPAGTGFGQNFAGGKIFFTPDTGAHAMAGAILDKYLALGGPTDGDLGFPTIDEGDGKAPGSRNTTFSAADRPVAFWTPDTGARVVRGALNAAWDKLGGSAGVLGVPTEDEVYRGDDVSQAFTGGQLSWNRKTSAFATTPPELADQLVGLEVPGDVTSAINAARRVAGGPLGPLGAVDGPQYEIGTDGAGQNYAGGKIFYSPTTGANVLTGQVLAKYESVGGPQGDLGFPTSNENDGGIAPMSMIATFAATDQPAIFWTPDYGAVIVRGAMNAAWAKLGGATGDLGAPTADQTENGDVVTQKFNGGAISWDKKTNGFTTEPAGLASQLSGLEVPGRDMPLTPAADAPGNERAPWYAFSWWWLLGIVPVLVLIGVVAAAVLLNRRRHDARPPLDGFDDDYDDEDDEGPEFDSGPIVVADDDDDEPEGRRSSWAMPDDEHGDVRVTDRPDAARGGAENFSADLALDQDHIDTVPTPVIAAQAGRPEGGLYPWLPGSGGPDDLDDPEDFDEPDDFDGPDEFDEAADFDEPDDGEEPASGPPSGRHAAIHLDEPVVAETSLRLASADPFKGPEGFPIKADTKSGLYWTPDNGHYAGAAAELWFASEEFALTNGFTKA